MKKKSVSQLKEALKAQKLLTQEKLSELLNSSLTYDENSENGIYVRASTDAQVEEGYSIELQLARLVAYCQAMGLKTYKIYADPGYSGSTLNRPQVQKLIADVEAGKTKTVLVFKLDRLSRSQKDTLFMLEDVFIPNDVKFISMTESLDTSTPYGRVMIGILSAFAQFERENIYLRTRSGMLERVKRGFWMGGGTVPFGYDYNKNQGILVPNEDAATVRKIYDLYIQGYSAQKIANLLGLKYDKLVNQILTRKSNLGIICYKGKEYEGKHEAIISQETYDLAMQKMQQRSVARARPSDAFHLLTSITYCGVCGGRMRYIKWGKDGYKLCCYSYDKSKSYMAPEGGPCGNDKVWADQVEKVVLEDLFQVAAEMKPAKGHSSEPLEPEESINALEELENRIDATARKLKRLYNLYAESDNEVLYDTILDTKEELETLQREYEKESELQKDVRDAAFAKMEVEGIADAWEYMTPQQQQAVVRDCISKVIVTHDHIDVYYRFKEGDDAEEIDDSETLEKN